ncbi:uncharacterized protein L201_002047 [Kwoniella dendrophila CBS 6074]|uniref:F-box domain-containing protein n=1 Tax=Kwoniella dendrophila CBS 6074 TaxID=1295534 RepID=A0AAX4JP53_9TREE
MLDQIPSEIISQISFHLSLSSLSSINPSGGGGGSSISTNSSSSTSLNGINKTTIFDNIPPTNLLLSCKSINDSISSLNNSRLYGKLFRTLFDIKAPERRFGSGSSNSSNYSKLQNDKIRKKRMKKRRRKIVLSTSNNDNNEDLDDNDDDGMLVIDGLKLKDDKLKAQELTKELKKRIQCLCRLKDMIDSRDVSDIEDEDLWTIYFMLIENDGKNIQHLIGPKATVNLPLFLDLYHEQHFLAAAVEPGYPAETPGRSLAMWIAWLVCGSGLPDETPEQREERMFVLRPYVFAAQQYPLYFAPWTIPDLPLSKPLPPQNESNPFIADLTPKSRLVQIEHFGRQLSLCPPFLAHAAILRFFYRKPGEDFDGDSENELDMITPPFMSIQNATGGAGGGANQQNHHNQQHQHQYPNGGQHGQHGQITNGVRVNELVDGIMPGTEGMILPSNPTSRAPTRPGSPSLVSREPRKQHFLLGNSIIHDRDFKRLKSCFDPLNTTKGLGLKSSNWKGSFDGCWEGTFSFFDFDAFREMLAGHARALYEGPYGEQAQVWRIKETYVRKIGWVKKQSEDNKLFSSDDSDSDSEDEDEDDLLDNVMQGDAKRRREKKEKEKEGLPLKGPMVNAGFPSTNVPPNTFSNLASELAEAETLKETLKQQIEAIKGYEIVPSQEELNEMLNNLNEKELEDSGLELLLTGTGHSAWGKFVLKGRVRSWDGMASLVKEYAPDSRGKWIYRGYVLAGDIFVGRWRDTYTPENFVGYEGTFILNRR